MKILVVQSTDSGVYYHRQKTPHFTWLESGDEFKDDGVVIVESHHIDKLPDIIDKNEFDIVQFSVRYRTPKEMIHMIDFVRYRDKSKIIIDVDDRYPKGRADVIKAIRDADGLTTTCDFLGQWYKDNGAKSIFTIENGIDSKEDQWQFKGYPDYFTFGYLGSTKHEADLDQMMWNLKPDQDFRERNYTYKDKVFFAVCEEYMNLLYFDDIGGLVHWKSYANYYDKIHVSLAPLVNTRFNRSKSLLKIIESGFKKRPIICTKIPPYNRDESLFPAIDFVPKRQSWKKRIQEYTMEEAIQRGEELYKLVQPYEVRNLNKKRREYYQKVLNRKK